jgi:hypothetical protein
MSPLVANAQEAPPGPNSSCGSLRIIGIVASKREFATSVNVDPNAGERWGTSCYFGPPKWAVSTVLVFFRERR